MIFFYLLPFLILILLSMAAHCFSVQRFAVNNFVRQITVIGRHSTQTLLIVLMNKTCEAKQIHLLVNTSQNICINSYISQFLFNLYIKINQSLNKSDKKSHISLCLNPANDNRPMHHLVRSIQRIELIKGKQVENGLNPGVA